MKPQMFEFSFWYTPIAWPDKLLLGELSQLIIASGHGVVGYKEHQFVPEGLTAVWVLSESHMAVHTYPEYRVAYVQLSSCNKALYGRLVELLEANLNGIQQDQRIRSLAKFPKP